TDTGVWQVGLAQASSFTVATFGTQDNLSAGGVFSLGDYDGDGDTDVVYLHQAPANTWRQLISSGSSFAETAVVAENTNTTGSWECAVASTQTLSGTPQGCSSIHLEPGRHSLWLWAQKSNLGGDIGLKL